MALTVRSNPDYYKWVFTTSSG